MFAHVAARIAAAVFINLVSYAILFPFAGAFVLTLYFSVRELGPSGIIGAILISPITGTLGVVMFWAFGFAAGVAACAFLANRPVNLIGNLCCSLGVTLSIDLLPGNIMYGGSAVAYLVAIVHAFVLTRISQAVLATGTHPPETVSPP